MTELNQWRDLVPFLGSVLGDSSEVLLETPMEGIIAVANGALLDHRVGDPIAPQTRIIIEEEDYKKNSFTTCPGHNPHTGKPIRSWHYYLKDQTEELVAVLSVYTDISDYLGVINSLTRLVEHRIPNAAEIPVVTTEKRGAVSSALIQMGLSHVEPHRLTDSEKQQLVEILSRHGVFEAKGAVNEIAQQLGVSDASVYRYLTAVTRGEKKPRLPEREQTNTKV